jgi:glycosyltransferase involved in cell wall biosynthesis
VNKAELPILIGTGATRLHFFETANSLASDGWPIEIAARWIPRVERWKLFKGIFGNGRMFRRLMERANSLDQSVHARGSVLHEPAAMAVHGLYKAGLLTTTRYFEAAFWWSAWVSRLYMKDQVLFHVRSGAGRAGAVSKARKLGMKILTDHSIAHPAVFDRYVVSEYERFGLQSPQTSSDRFWKNFVMQDCYAADALLVNSDYIKETFIEAGFAADRIHVAYLGVREDFIGLKQQYELNAVPRLLFTGSFDLRKGVRVLLEALPLIERDFGPVLLDVVGPVSASGEAALARYPEARRLIRFHSFLPQEELKAFLTESDVYVFPTLCEGCARSVMEAMAAGMPVVTTGNSGVPIEDGGDGLLVPVGDAEALAKAVINLLKQKSLRARIGERAAETVRRKFLWSDYARAVGRCYAQVLGFDALSGE